MPRWGITDRDTFMIGVWTYSHGMHGINLIKNRNLTKKPNVARNPGFAAPTRISAFAILSWNYHAPVIPNPGP